MQAQTGELTHSLRPQRETGGLVEGSSALQCSAETETSFWPHQYSASLLLYIQRKRRKCVKSKPIWRAARGSHPPHVPWIFLACFTCCLSPPSFFLFAFSISLDQIFQPPPFGTKATAMSPTGQAHHQQRCTQVPHETLRCCIYFMFESQSGSGKRGGGENREEQFSCWSNVCFLLLQLE